AKAAPRTAPLASQPAAATPRPLTQGQGYLVQMGVFSNIANAEELKGRLDKAGIPAHIEARVQVGPFRNKAEAEAAQKKLSEMGLSGLLLSPRK
ncbi:MAG TPA: SPOR domain-containing protein, partial [Rhodocyclaceae bacterium]|nr:SPOR domain-containing protein [Rhodocyclaceae bacterium]